MLFVDKPLTYSPLVLWRRFQELDGIMNFRITIELPEYSEHPPTNHNPPDCQVEAGTKQKDNCREGASTPSLISRRGGAGRIDSPSYVIERDCIGYGWQVLTVGYGVQAFWTGCLGLKQSLFSYVAREGRE